MKRPEGFDGSAQSAPEDESNRRVSSRRKVSRETQPPETPQSRARGAAGSPPAPREGDGSGLRAASRIPRPSAERTAAAELRAAARARKRQERRELRRFTRHARQRRIAWLTGIGIALALLAVGLVAVYSPVLALREVRVVGAERVDSAQVVAALEGQLGTPLALVDEERIREELGAFSLIRSYSTELIPPGTLLVNITERTPIGAIVRGAVFELVDAAGVVVSSSPDRPEGVPVITVSDDDVDSVAFRSVAEVLSVMPPELLAQLDTVSASTRDDVTLTLTGSVQRVEWGSAESSAHKARVLSALVAIHGDSGPGLYDVSAPGSAVFRAD